MTSTATAVARVEAPSHFGEADDSFSMGLTRSTSTMRSAAPSAAAAQPPSSSRPPRTKSTGNAAAMELWDLIHHSGPPQQQPQRRIPAVPRFTEAQAGRTLVHPELVQPTAEEGEARLRQVLLNASRGKLGRSDDPVEFSTVSTDESSGEDFESLPNANTSVPNDSPTRRIKNENQTHATRLAHDDDDDDGEGDEPGDREEGDAERRESDLRARLSQALLLGSCQSRANLCQSYPPSQSKESLFPSDKIQRDDDGYLVGEGEVLYDEDGAGGPTSPTSTLHFPDPFAAQHKAAEVSEDCYVLERQNEEENHDELFEEDQYEEDGLDVSPTSTLHFPNTFSAPIKLREPGPAAPLVQAEGDGVAKETRDDAEASDTVAQKDGRRVTEMERHSPLHTFVVCADSQIGMTSRNREWETELNYCRRAIRRINALQPRPRFVCVCGDLVDMEHSFHTKPNPIFGTWTREECDEVQDRQNEDFKRCWEALHPSIGLVCLCGNHDVGNRPTPASIQKFRNAFGDDYLSFWCNGTYNVILNNVLFSDPTGSPAIFDEQLRWLEGRLSYARSHGAAQIFVFGHHPWFLYHEDEGEDLTGSVAFPLEWDPPEGAAGFPDFYFHIKLKYRRIALDLFRRYDVDAAFSGHFHQNLISRTEWGMDHIITAPLSMVFESSGKPAQDEGNGRGIRVVEVTVDADTEGGGFGKGRSGISHWFEKI